MTMPAKIWIRSLSPSTTRVCTRTPSPILNLVTSVLNCSFSIASIILFIMKSSRRCSRLALSRRGSTRVSVLTATERRHYSGGHFQSEQGKMQRKDAGPFLIVLVLERGWHRIDHEQEHEHDYEKNGRLCRL